MKRTPITRKTRLSPVSPKNVTRIGKLGIVRLRGADLLALKHACHERDGWRCVECGTRVACYCGGEAHAFGTYLIPADWRQYGHMAHIRTKRNSGDTLDNVRTLCRDCHQREHNAGGKPVPAKERRD